MANLRYYSKQKNDLQLCIDDLTEKMQQMDVCKSVEGLLLLEAQSRQNYYQTFNVILNNPVFTFVTRTKQPPEDPINALISFGNTLLYNKILDLIINLSPILGEKFFKLQMFSSLFELLPSEQADITICFIKKQIDFEIDSQCINDSLFEEIRDKNILLKGRGPIEIYALFSYWLVKKGCASLSINDFASGKNITVYDRNNIPLNHVPEWCGLVSSSSSQFLVIKPSESEDGKWSLDTVKNTCGSFSIPKEKDKLFLKGQGSLVFYSCLACSAAVSGFENVFIDKPTDSNYLRIAGTCAIEDKQSSSNGKIIGVLGDPNSGKSVFSKVLGCVLRIYSESKTVWVYDCDAASPTSDWFIYGLQVAKNSEEQERIVSARTIQKQKWTERLENEVALKLRQIRKNIDIVVADFPGGYHTDEVHNRIPGKSRAEMIANCDSLIILGREDKPDIVDEWMNALQEYGLSQKVVATILSGAPDEKPETLACSFSDEGLFSATVRGLSRKKKRNDIVQALQEPFAFFVASLLRK